MASHVSISTTVGVQEALSRMDVDALQEHLQKFLWQTVSYYDTQGENFYHGLVLGLCAMMDSHYAVTSNREAGEGRYDVQLMPKMIGLPGIIIELKYKKDVDEEELRNISRDALKQIDERKYDTQMKEAEISSIYKYGVAFSGKSKQDNVCVYPVLGSDCEYLIDETTTLSGEEIMENGINIQINMPRTAKTVKLNKTGEK